ncbi:MAG: hypothetical protein K6E73_00075 [Bacteroidales bacterium]|nr:hypothetical protein [Bacteroidales bacterium]
MSYFENFGGKHSPVNIHNEIQMAALGCASKGSHFLGIWLVLLQKLLQYWNVSTSMDLRDATTIMLHSAGYLFEEDWHDTHPSNSYTFWYKYEDRPNFLTVRT